MVTLEMIGKGMHLEVGRSDDEWVEEVIKGAIENWPDTLSRSFQSMGFRVEIVE